MNDVSLDALHAAISPTTQQTEEDCINHLLEELDYPRNLASRIQDRAQAFVKNMQDMPEDGVEAFMQEYNLSEKEGVLIMCLAEALLRIPDTETADRLIKDKFREAEWAKHLGKSDSTFVNASTWGLMLTGKVIGLGNTKTSPYSALAKLVSKSGEPVIRQALVKAMKIMGQQFILGRSIDEALKNSAKAEKFGYCYSYDILGEAARTMDYAEKYKASYLDAIEKIGKRGAKISDMREKPGASIKLSALHPRYDMANRSRVMTELYSNLKELLLAAKKAGIIAAIDAEEARRLDISLEIFEKLLRDPDFKGYDGIGIVVQAYQKRALPVLHWLKALAKDTGKMIPIRLVKGAYWDSEIKDAQSHGHKAFAVFTRKENTDVSYLTCAQFMLENAKHFYPQFATHNAHTVAAILEMAPAGIKYEFQRLHGMGETLHDQVVKDKNIKVPCRIYAPIGKHADLLAYLVRRLLENGANTSFINRLSNKNMAIAEIISDPVKDVKKHTDSHANPDILLPDHLYRDKRLNSRGEDLGHVHEVDKIYAALAPFQAKKWEAAPFVCGQTDHSGEVHESTNPAYRKDVVGKVYHTPEATILVALEAAYKARDSWDSTPVKQRADILRKAADLLEEHKYEAIMLCIREAGKTMQDCIDEVREAVDFLRYYAIQAEKLCGAPHPMDGPTGESNAMTLHGRGVFMCISPWNFPLAIFIGEVSAALAAGNTVLAKPAEQTSLIGTFAVRLLHEAGVPNDVLHLLTGPGSTIGKHVLSDNRVAGVVFTGSTQTAHIINRTLAARSGMIANFIAETGGQNCMIVDSSSLPEQVVDDVIRSAFYSAGQRCSALRVLYLQEDIADTVIAMLKGAMAELNVGDPYLLSTDLGPVIDDDARDVLLSHIKRMKKEAKLIYEVALDPEHTEHGCFVAPTAFEIKSVDQLEDEQFGPILHIVRYKAKELDKVIDEINNTEFGLTAGIHSRIEQNYNYIATRLRVGNCYINRSMTGAVVGVQPFGGEGLSGTGPKAGGPNYLLRFLTERTLTINTAAIGGNIDLFR